MTQSPLIRLENISKIYTAGEVKVHALKNVSMEIYKGEFLAIMGPSGSGKTTLMNIIGCLDKPTSGKYYFEGIDICNQSDDKLAEIRGKRIGFVFQTFNLLPRLTVIDNVTLPLIYIGGDNARQRALEALKKVGLEDKGKRYPSQLSGGEQQRVAIARAIVPNPATILADEPTGNLDSKTGQEIINIFKYLHNYGHTIIIVTHNRDIAKNAERIVLLKDGYIETETCS